MMGLPKIICVLSMSALFFAQAAAQTKKPTKERIINKREDTPSFIFSFRALVTNVIDGCNVNIEIKEGRTGKIQEQESEVFYSNPDYQGAKVIRLVNTKCVSINQTVGLRSKEMLSQAVEGKMVEVFFRTYADIKNSEIIGQLIVVESGKDAGLEQIETGMAMFRNDKERIVTESDKRKYKNAEKMAKEQKIGIWGDSD